MTPITKIDTERLMTLDQTGYQKILILKKNEIKSKGIPGRFLLNVFS